MSKSVALFITIALYMLGQMLFNYFTIRRMNEQDKLIINLYKYIKGKK